MLNTLGVSRMHLTKYWNMICVVELHVYQTITLRYWFNLVSIVTVNKVSLKVNLNNSVKICGFFGRIFRVVGRAMNRKYTSAKTAAWVEEAAAKRTDAKEGVRVVKVMFPIEEELGEEDIRLNDIGDSFPNAIWPG